MNQNQEVSKKISDASLIGWCLFDFANSIAAVIGGIYFTKWYVEDLGAGSILLNILFFVSALLIILCGRWIGKKVDETGYKVWIIWATKLSITANILIFVASQFVPNQYLIITAFGLYLLFLLGFQAGRICHNSYLSKFIPKPLHSKMSGWGTASNWAGSVIGILITIPIVSLYPGRYARELTFLVSSIVFGLITVIALYLMFLSNVTIEKTAKVNKPKRVSHHNIIALGGKLLIYFLLFDVMLTVERNLPTFLSEVHGMSDDVQALRFLFTLLAAVVGGIIASKIVSGASSQLWLKVCSMTLAVSIVLITIEYSWSLNISFILAGLSYGILESAMRVNFLSKFSHENAGEYFGIYAIVERTSGVIGPLFWLLTFSGSRTNEPYITSMLVMAALALIAFGLLMLSPKHLK